MLPDVVVLKALPVMAIALQKMNISIDFGGHLNISLNGVITGFTIPNCYSSITIFSTLILTDHLYSRDDRFFVEFTNHSVNSSNLVLG